MDDSVIKSFTEDPVIALTNEVDPRELYQPVLPEGFSPRQVHPGFGETKK